jgi:ABC-type uncharacterized transport system permease subunit
MAIAVVVVVGAVYVWSTRSGIRLKSVDDAHSEAMTDGDQAAASRLAAANLTPRLLA